MPDVCDHDFPVRDGICSGCQQRTCRCDWRGDRAFMCSYHEGFRDGVVYYADAVERLLESAPALLANELNRITSADKDLGHA